jgi:DNA-binding NarL/FixJ family response regulator
VVKIDLAEQVRADLSGDLSPYLDRPHFTPRQLQLIHLLARGLDSSEIAAELGITERTVKAHCDLIRLKMGLSSRIKIPATYREMTGIDPYLEGEKQ